MHGFHATYRQSRPNPYLAFSGRTAEDRRRLAATLDTAAELAAALRQ